MKAYETHQFERLKKKMAVWHEVSESKPLGGTGGGGGDQGFEDILWQLWDFHLHPADSHRGGEGNTELVQRFREQLSYRMNIF